MTQPNPSAETGIAIPSGPALSSLAGTVGPNMAQPSQLNLNAPVAFERFLSDLESNDGKTVIQMRQEIVMFNTPQKNTKDFEAWLSSPEGSAVETQLFQDCLLYTSPSPRDS